MTTYIPQQYLAELKAAASAAGLPLAVAAAQINEESGFNPDAVSPTGAEGIAQFEPGTWVSWGTGSPFNPANAFPAYGRYMGALIRQFGGSIRDGLAAYNAGPGNIQAGMGYADTILSNAGEGYGITSGGGTSTGLPINVTITGEAQVEALIRQIAQSSQQLVWTRMVIRGVARPEGGP